MPLYVSIFVFVHICSRIHMCIFIYICICTFVSAIGICIWLGQTTWSRFQSEIASSSDSPSLSTLSWSYEHQHRINTILVSSWNDVQAPWLLEWDPESEIQVWQRLQADVKMTKQNKNKNLTSKARKTKKSHSYLKTYNYTINGLSLKVDF